MHCIDCGGFLTEKVSGGCGGMGAVYECDNCGAKWLQESGGFVSSPISLKRLPKHYPTT